MYLPIKKSRGKGTKNGFSRQICLENPFFLLKATGSICPSPSAGRKEIQYFLEIPWIFCHFINLNDKSGAKSNDKSQ
jgi:hypothetical protein